jgi:hypothetical protein
LWVWACECLQHKSLWYRWVLPIAGGVLLSKIYLIPFKALKRDLIGMSMTNTTKLVTPCFGTQYRHSFKWLHSTVGAERMLGTNPIAIAFPGKEEPPIVIDMATAVIAYGKASNHNTNFDHTSLWPLDLLFSYFYKQLISCR